MKRFFTFVFSFILIISLSEYSFSQSENDLVIEDIENESEDTDIQTANSISYLFTGIGIAGGILGIYYMQQEADCSFNCNDPDVDERDYEDIEGRMGNGILLQGLTIFNSISSFITYSYPVIWTNLGYGVALSITGFTFIILSSKVGSEDGHYANVLSGMHFRTGIFTLLQGVLNFICSVIGLKLLDDYYEDSNEEDILEQDLDAAAISVSNIGFSVFGDGASIQIALDY